MHRTVPTAENWLAASGSSARLEKRRVSAACGWVSPTKRAPLMSSFQPVSQNGTVSSLKAFSVLLILKCSSKIIFFRELIKPIWLQPPPHTFFTEHLWVGGGHTLENTTQCPPGNGQNPWKAMTWPDPEVADPHSLFFSPFRRTLFCDDGICQKRYLAPES